MFKNLRSQRGEGPAAIILGALVLAIIVVVGNWLLGFIKETKDERAGHGKKKFVTPTPIPVTEEPGGFTKIYRPGLSTTAKPTK